MKSEPTEWEKIFTSHISGNGLVSKICKFSSKRKEKTNSPI